MNAETATERRAWDLLTRDFYWRVPADFEVKIFGDSAVTAERTRLQVFEVTVAAIFARLRPDYEWYVTPNRPDGGLDFVGRQRFLEDEALGIAAAITVGGQCKKRTSVSDVVAEIAGSLARMAVTLNPTFFVVAFSARLDRSRVDQARAILEQTHHRHCHILDRRQIEGLIHDHLGIVHEILQEGLTAVEVQEVLKYFEGRQHIASSHSIEVAAPDRVLAGVPFSVTLRIRSPIVGSAQSRLWWKPRRDIDAPDVTLIGPIGADDSAGVQLTSGEKSDDPIYARRSIEFVTHSIGEVDLGEVRIAHNPHGTAGLADPMALGSVRVIENTRPRFFERPFRAGLTRLAQEYDRALAGGVASIGVVGAGGSGKSRMCEEFSLEKRRRGCFVVTVKPAKTFDDPHRLLAELLTALAEDDAPGSDPADRVVHAVSRYDLALAERAESAIRSLFGSHATPGPATEQGVLSALVLLIVARGRRVPLIVHLQDLHWCTADVLLLLERLVWQLGLVLDSTGASLRSPESGILFVFEGRVRERPSDNDDAQLSEALDVFLRKLGCPIVTCASFEPDDALEFTRRLFEDRYSARRLLAADLLLLQGELIEQINHTAGGNPFHSLEQVQLLTERRVLGKNPDTGLLYLIQPAPARPELPDSVFESIKLRWKYLSERAPELALLLWAAALLEDRTPADLFRNLHRAIAPNVSTRDIDATDFLWTGDGGEGEVAFRHENYFQSLRLLEVSSRDRERVVTVYLDWFSRLRRPSPGDRFRWARALLERTEPDVVKARTLLANALRSARHRGDARLARRIWSASLDLAWNCDDRREVADAAFLKRCEDDLALARDLLGSDLHQAALRLDNLRNRVQKRVSDGRTRGPVVLDRLDRCQLMADVLRSRILFNDRHPAAALEVAERAVRGVRALRPGGSAADIGSRRTLEMEALDAQAVALALSGEIEAALRTSEGAVDLASRSPSPLSLSVIATYANILLANDPIASELMLRELLEDARTAAVGTESRNLIEITLSMALVLQSHQLLGDDHEPRSMLAEAGQRLAEVFAGSFRLGTYPDAAAAALMLGIVSVLQGTDDAASWFAQAVAAAARGRQIETLWRAHINLASALYRSEQRVTPNVRDHALAALEIMEDTLSAYPDADRSARFALIRVPLAQAVRFATLAGDEAGTRALEKYPELRRCFSDSSAGVLLEDRGGHESHEWVRVGGEDYVIY